MSNKIRVGVLFGGKSTEHEISLRSAKNIIAAIDANKYEAVLIGIDKTGQWMLGENAQVLLESAGAENKDTGRDDSMEMVFLNQKNNQTQLTTLNHQGVVHTAIDVIFPILHGAYGEDGTMQGFLKLMDVPFVGSGVLGSAVAMDKDIAKRLWRDAGIPIADFLTIRKHSTYPTYETVKEKLGLPFFIKPANAGSSVGVSKVSQEADYLVKLHHAFEFDHKVLIEEAIMGKELECAVLGNEQPVASAVGEIIPQHDFYSYEAKYLSDDGAAMAIPADISEVVAEKIRALAIDAYQAIACEGLSRVDFLYDNKDKIVINEINTLPGFTSISMYPKLWEHSGMTQTELVDRLIQLAIERHERNQQLKFSL
ncbi:MAG: D-alanine--D-alanine ligase [Chitinophagales bacterium]